MVSSARMRSFPFASTIIILLSIVCTVSAIYDLRLPRPYLSGPHLHHEERLQANSEVRNWLLHQQPIMGDHKSEAIMPSSTAPDEDTQKPDQKKGPIVADVLPKVRGINIFAGLTRDFEPIASHLNDASKNVTVLAPRNSAIQALPRKPWENPTDYEQHGEAEAYQGQEGQDRAQKNLQRFVEAHVVPTSPWKKDQEVESLAGGKLRWTKEGDKIFIQPGNIEVDSIAEQVSNGEVWILNGVVNYV